MKVLVAYDGTLQAKEALRYGSQKVKENGGELVALHVFNSGLFIDYDAHPGAVEMARRDSLRFVEEAKRLIAENGVLDYARVVSEEGVPSEEIMRYATEKNVDILLCPPRYKSVIKSFRRVLDEKGRKAYEDTILDEAERPKLAVVSRI